MQNFDLEKRRLSKKKVILVFIFFLLCIGVFFGFRLMFLEVSPVLKMVSGTEYISGEEGQIIIRLTDRNDNPITDARCSADVLYPAKNFFFMGVEMVHSDNTPGNYYKTFTTPETVGIYEETITCRFTRNGQEHGVKVSSSFHVSVALNFIVELSRRESEHYEDLLRKINTTYLELLRQFDESSANFDNINITIHESFGQLYEVVEAEFDETNELVNGSSERLYSDMRDLGSALVEIFSES